MRTVIEKSQQKLTLQLLEVQFVVRISWYACLFLSLSLLFFLLCKVVDIVLFCLDQDWLKKKNLLDLFPPFSRWAGWMAVGGLTWCILADVGCQMSAIPWSPSDWLWVLGMDRLPFMTWSKAAHRCLMLTHTLSQCYISLKMGNCLLHMHMQILCWTYGRWGINYNCPIVVFSRGNCCCRSVAPCLGSARHQNWWTDGQQSQVHPLVTALSSDWSGWAPRLLLFTCQGV